jgi:hypothetical protein
MVLQRAPQRAILWGYADSSNTLTILTMDDQVYRALSSSSPVNGLGESMWFVTLDAQTGEEPFQIQVT